MCEFIEVYDIVSGVFIIFFVKQKTAYEMRISDWSSDVCSSDLHRAYDVEIGQARLHHHAVGALGEVLRDFAPGFLGVRGVHLIGPLVDWRSVVSGKSVSVRVDLGGRRIIKIKITIQRSLCHLNTLITTTNSINV